MIKMGTAITEGDYGHGYVSGVPDNGGKAGLNKSGTTVMGAFESRKKELIRWKAESHKTNQSASSALNFNSCLRSEYSMESIFWPVPNF